MEQIVSESSVEQIVSEDDNSSVDHHVAECSGDSVDKIVAEWMLMLTEIVFSPGAQRRSKLLQQLHVLKRCIQVINSIKQEKLYNLNLSDDTPTCMAV